MRRSHQISLPADVWNNFVYGLNNCNQSQRKKMNAFFAEIEQNLAVQYEAHQIVVESSNLDEDAILAAMSSDNAQYVSQNHSIETFYTITESPFVLDNILTVMCQEASEDCYHRLLTEKTMPAVTAYRTENAAPNRVAAA